MRIATFNAENIFSRPWAMSHDDHKIGQPVLDDMVELSGLFKKTNYTAAVKQRIEELVEKYQLLNRQLDESERRIVLRQVRGRLWIDRQDGTRDWVATGAADFLAWLELATVAVDDRAIANTARVITAVNADIQLLNEIENRTTLQRFHDEVLLPLDTVDGVAANPQAYKHVLLMDGNDPRGIDVALMSRVPVSGMRSHVELERAPGKPMFARDCALFVFDMPDGERMVMLGNHLSSKGSDVSGKRRGEQSKEVARLVDEALQWTPYVCVCGDLNEPPSDGNMPKLLNHPQLKDVMSMPEYTDPFPGTYKTAGKAGGSDSTKLDYILLSTALQAKVQAVGIERRGYVSTKWEPFQEIQDALAATPPADRPREKERIQASDHHCLWVDLNF
jgi:endonuclease/exonuclease/phosphatase family metal-dependent hydrolase